MENALPLIVPMKCSKEFESRWGEKVDEDDLDDLLDDLVA